MNKLIKGAMVSLGLWALKAYQQRLIRSIRIEALKLYVKGLGTARKICISVLVASGLLLLLAIAFAMIHVGILMLLPFSLPIKALIVLVLGIIYAGAAIYLLGMLTSEKTWLEVSSASEMIAEVTRTN